MKSVYPNHELVKDIGSGLNFKRKGFNSLLDRIMSGDVEEVVITHKDRLCWSGYEIFETIANKNSCKIMVLNESNLSPTEEITTDLLPIIHVFSCRLYGLRKYSGKIKKDKDLSKE